MTDKIIIYFNIVLIILCKPISKIIIILYDYIVCRNIPISTPVFSLIGRRPIIEVHIMKTNYANLCDLIIIAMSTKKVHTSPHSMVIVLVARG